MSLLDNEKEITKEDKGSFNEGPHKGVFTILFLLVFLIFVFILL